MQLGGLSLLSAGFFIVAPWLGCMVAGLALFGIGWAVDGSDGA